MEAVKSSIWGNIVMEASVLLEVTVMEQLRVLFKVTLLWKQLKVLFEVTLLWKQLRVYVW